MNRNRYRLVFDKRTNTLIPVAEFTASAKKGGGGGAGDAMGDRSTPRWSRACATLALACWGGLGVPLSLQAQTVPDPSSAMTVGTTANGTELVNIVNPDLGGLSHNKATEFNVTPRGTVLNNSLDDGVSRIGGYAMGNYNLSREASAILMEVTGANRSRLEGTVEVFGGKADVFIANQNGLYFNDSTWVNTGGVTLTTGRPTGDGRTFEVHGGDIEGHGLSLDALSYAHLVARSIRLHGALKGSDDTDLRLVAGLNTFDATTGAVARREAGGGADAPAFAIDASTVAMHGRHVSLVSTESGLGVRHEGALTAVDDIEITVDGDLRLRSLRAAGGANISAADISVGGDDRIGDLSIELGGTLQADARGDLMLLGHHRAEAFQLQADGTLVSNGNVESRRRTADSRAAIDVRAGAMALTGNGNWKADDGLAIAAGTMMLAEGARLTASDIALMVDGTLDNAGIVSANDGLHVRAGLLVNGGELSSVASARFIAGRLDNRGTGSLSALGDVDLVLLDGASTNAGTVFAGNTLGIFGDQATLANRGALLADAGLLMDAAALVNHAHGLLWSRQVLLRLGRLDNEGALSGNDLDISAGWLRNAGSGAELIAGQSAVLAIAHDLENTQGAVLSAAHRLAIDVDGNLRNDDGAGIDVGEPGGVLALRAGGDFDNTGDAKLDADVVAIDVGGGLRNDATILGYDTLSISAGTLDNAGAGDVYGGVVDVTTRGALVNRDGALLAAAGTLVASVGGALDNSGLLSARDIAATIAGDLVNRDGGRIQADGDLEASVGGDFSNRGADSAVLGLVVDLDVAGDAENVDAALVQATDTLSLEAATLANRDAKLLAGAVTRDGRLLVGDMTLSATDGDIVNDGEVIATGDVWIDAAGNLRNDANGLIAAENLIASVGGDLANAGDATIDAVGIARLDVGGALGNAGAIAGHGVLVAAADAIDNSGSITGGSWIAADTTALRNAASGSIQARDDVDLSTETVANTGKIHSDGATTLTIENGLDLTVDGTMHGPTAAGVLTLNADDVHVRRTLSNAGHIVVNATGDIDNIEGIVTGKTFLAAADGDFINRSLTWAADDIDITAASLTNEAGAEIEAGRHLWLDIDGTLVNEAGARIAARGSASIDAQALRNEVRYDGTGVRKTGETRATGTYRDGEVTYEVWIGWDQEQVGTLGQYAWVQRDGLDLLGADLTITAQGQIEAGGTLRINQDAKLDQGATVFNQGLIQAGGNLLVNGDVDNQGIAASESIEDYLRRPVFFVAKAQQTFGQDRNDFQSTWDFLDHFLSRRWTASMGLGRYWHSSEVWNTIKAVNNNHLKQLLSHILLPDYASVDYDTIVERWNTFKADVDNRSGIQAVADRGPELMAGGSVVHDGGHFRNTSGARYYENQEVTVMVGDEEVTTIAGHFDVKTHLRDLAQAIDPRQALDAFTADNNRKFRRVPDVPEVEPVDWTQFPPPTGPVDVAGPPVDLVPIYESAIEFVDPDQFYDSRYWAEQVGFRFDRTVLVIAGGHGINQLVNEQATSAVGGFFTAELGVSGASLTKRLMDNAGVEGPRLGLQVGVAPTAAQLAQLDHDIVWFVAMDVDGVTALVPQVFLSQATVTAVQADRAAGGAIVAAGGDILVDANEGGVRNHNGVMRAKGDVDIRSAGDIENISDNGLAGGGMRAGGNLILEAKGELVPMTMDEVLARGIPEDIVAVPLSWEEVVAAGPHDVMPRIDEDTGIVYLGDEPQTRVERVAKDIRVDAETGIVYVDDEPQLRGTASVSNIGGTMEGQHVFVDTTGDFTDAVRMGYGRDGSLVVRQQSRIVGDGDGGSVTIRARGDIDMAASDVRAQDVMLLAEQGNVRIQDVHEVKSSFGQVHVVEGGTTTTTRAEARSVGSTLRGAADGGSLAIVAGQGSVVLEAGEYGADHGLIKAGGDVVTKTGRDYTHEKTHLVAEGIATGVRAGALGASAGAEYGPLGYASSSTGSGAQNPDAAGGKSNATATNPGKAVLGESAGLYFGYQRIEETTTRDTVTNHNAQLDFGTGVAIVADGTVDIGGVDIRAQRGVGDDAVKGDVVLRAAAVTSTVFEDIDRTTTERETTFVGLTGSGQSSVLDAASKSRMLADKQAQGMTIDPGMTAAQAAGDATNLVFNDAAGGSANLAGKHTIEKSTETTRTETINTIVGNIDIASTVGDIDLNGVVLDGNGASVILDSARDINVRSAVTRTEGASSRQDHQVTVGVNAGAAPTGAGLGASVGYNGSLSESEYESTRHANSSIVGSNVVLRSRGDTTLAGANVVGHAVDLDIGGNLDVVTLQDTHSSRTVRGNWGASAGAALNSQTGVGIVAAGDAGGGRSWDDGALTGEQSGIRGATIDGRVGGDLTQEGSHLVATDGGNVAVGGQHVGRELRDTHEADGWYGGGGGGTTKTGRVTVNLQLERDDRIGYESLQHNTVSGLTVDAEGGREGRFDADADNMESVLRDERVAGNSMSMTVGIGDLQDLAGSRTRTTRDSGSADLAPVPTPAAASRRPSTTSVDGDAPEGVTRFDSTPIAPDRASPDGRARAPAPDATPDVATRPPTPDAPPDAPTRGPVADPADVVLQERVPQERLPQGRTPSPDDDSVTYERGARLQAGVGRPVDADRVTDVGDGMYLILDDHGQPTRRYAELRVVDGVERFVEAGAVNRINAQPATPDDVRDLVETHRIERLPANRERPTHRPAVGPEGNDARVLPRPDYDDE